MLVFDADGNAHLSLQEAAALMAVSEWPRPRPALADSEDGRFLRAMRCRMVSARAVLVLFQLL